MDLEVRGLPSDSKTKCGSKLKSYKEESEKLEQNFVSFLTFRIIYKCIICTARVCCICSYLKVSEDIILKKPFLINLCVNI